VGRHRRARRRTVAEAVLTLLRLFLEVKRCSKALLGSMGGHGKSPCFLEVAFLQSVGPDYRLLILPSVDGAENMECAFCYGSQ
jgi:hypothetical protein